VISPKPTCGPEYFAYNPKVPHADERFLPTLVFLPAMG
jgi:hypothetical protein